MKHRSTKSPIIGLAVFALMLTTLAPGAFAADPDDLTQPPMVCYPSFVTRSDNGEEIRKVYDLSPEDDPAGIPRSGFEQDGYRYELSDLLKQELPEQESRQYTETVSIASKSKDMATVLSLLPQEREFITEDGFKGVLSLCLDTVKADVAGYGSSTKELTASRTYPGLSSQDTSSIPKSIEENGHTLTLLSIDWQRAGADGSEQYTAVASYSGAATNSYIKGYTITADYSGTVSRINLNKIRYVAIFEGKAIPDEIQENTQDTTQAEPSPEASQSNVPLVVGISALAGICFMAFWVLKRRKG